MGSLDALFNPRGIAVIGASNRPLTIGHRILANLQRYRFPGPITPVNPKGGEILGLPVARSILEVPHEVDLAHVIVRGDRVAETLEDCARKGARFCVINTSGFKEVGGEGIAREEELVAIGRRTGLRLFGPNCQGVMNTGASLYSNFTFAPMRPGHVSIVAQGGGVAEVINNYFGMHGVGQRMYASNGNACDVSIPEILEHYGADPETHVIVLHVESFADPAEFLRRVAPVAARKPILALKSGTTPEGARAVSSHTGGLMEQDTITDALFDKAGVLRFASLAELCETATAFATQPVPRGPRVGMVTNAGSPAIIVTDEAVARGLQVPDLAESSKKLLREKLQAIASVANPIDMMATASGEEFGASLRALVEDPHLDAIVVCFMTPFFVDTQGIARAVAEHAHRTDRTLIAVAMTNPAENPEWKATLEIVQGAGVPVYYFPEAAAKVLYNMDRYRRLRDRARSAPPELDVDRERAEQLFYRATAEDDAAHGATVGDDGFLPPSTVRDLLQAYGLPVVAERRADSGDALKAAAGEIGYPVVLKAEAPGLLHKSDAGGVALDLANESELEVAYGSMKEKLGDTKGLSFLIQEQVRGGVEVIVGGAAAPGLGSTVMFGLGGVHVELLGDVVFKLAPLCREEAEEMLEGIAASKILDGVRGAPPVDREALAEVLLRVSRLLRDFPEIVELDLNPVIALRRGEGARVVDARICIRG
jgi:acyl-CoA synthetase (NDP forming)